MLTAVDRMLAMASPPVLRNLYTRGMRRLAEYGLPRGTNVRETAFGFKMEVDRLDSIKWYVHYFGCFEPVITKAWINLIRPGDHVIDIGGNIGYHALLAATLAGPTGEVHTFEASSRIFDQLCRNVELNGFRNVIGHRVAVADGCGEVTISYGGENSQGDSSIVPDRRGENLERVRSISFDEIDTLVPLSRARIIKIDVEGAERMVLAGLYRNLSKLSDDCVLFVEISPENSDFVDEMIQPFFDDGFKVKVIENSYRTEYYNPQTPITLKDLTARGTGIVDLVLTRDAAIFDHLAIV